MDAILLKSENSNEYELLINEKSPEARIRFTLAHELGHILMPWHQGTFACVTREGSAYVVDDVSSEIIEAEANRFAGELLIPHEWVKNEALNVKDPGKLLKKIVQDCEVSIPAAFFGMAKGYPAGYLFALKHSSSDHLLYLNKSHETTVDFPIVSTTLNKYGIRVHNENITYEALSKKIKNYTDSGKTEWRSYDFFWWQYDFTSEYSDFIQKDSKKILKEIISECFDEDPSMGQATLRSVHAIAATVNSHRNFSSAADLYSRMKQNFQERRENVQSVMDHPQFDNFLKNKAQELFNNRKK